MPPGVVTTTSTAPAACAGVVAVTVVALTTARPVAATPPMVTEVAPVKSVPVIVTAVPPALGPLVGIDGRDRRRYWTRPARQRAGGVHDAQARGHGHRQSAQPSCRYRERTERRARGGHEAAELPKKDEATKVALAEQNRLVETTRRIGVGGEGNADLLASGERLVDDDGSEAA